MLEQQIEKIISQEYEMFDEVQNVNGRASCQDDFKTFRIMRASQFSAWDEATLDLYDQDLVDAKAANINLMTEKYGYMMMETDPAGFSDICDRLSPVSPEKLAIIEPLIQIHHQWLIEFASEFPHLARNGRAISQDEVESAGETSTLTYLKGELLTYSMPTLLSYSRLVYDYIQANKNMHHEILKATVRYYGYASLKAAEASLL